MNVYDFDGTIYSGDCTIDFYFYCLSKNIGVLKKIPKQLKGALLYAIGKIDKTQFKEYFYAFLSEVPDPHKMLCDFWDKKKKNIKQWYLKQRTCEDVVVSASPAFLLEPICYQLGVNKVLASNVDMHTGKYSGLNCRGEEKVKRFCKEFPDATIEEFYSDTESDKPLATIAQNSFFVRGKKLSEWRI